MQSLEGGNAAFTKLGKAGLWREGEKKDNMDKKQKGGDKSLTRWKINQFDLQLLVSKNHDHICNLGFGEILMYHFNKTSIFAKIILKMILFLTSKWFLGHLHTMSDEYMSVN